MAASRISRRDLQGRPTVFDLPGKDGDGTRRLFAAVGHEVTRLLRVAYGPIDLGTLQPGRWRDVSAAEFSRP
jgi:hypothetical protein